MGRSSGPLAGRSCGLAGGHEDPDCPHLWIAVGGRPIRSGPIAGIWSNHVRLYEPAELEERVRAAGFEIEVLEKARHYSFRFSHFLVYGIAKPLVENDLLPRRLRVAADRFSGLENTGSRWNPFNAGRALFRLVDRLNDRRPSPGGAPSSTCC